MKKLLLPMCVILIPGLILPGCSIITGEEAGESVSGDITVDTEFERMLGYVPYTLLQEHDIWFGDRGRTLSLYGLEDVKTAEEMAALPEDIKMKAGQVWRVAGLTGMRIAHYPDISDYIGFDVDTVDRALYGDIVPPHGLYILEGDFDEALIGGKLLEQGYTKIPYNQHSYYSIRNDFQMDIRHPLGKLVLASMNQVAVLDDTIIFSPAKADITGTLDTMDGNTPSAINNAACRALADSLGDVLAATLTTPERIIFSELVTEEEKPFIFDFNIPDNWGTLHSYEMAGLGYRDEGGELYFDIALYYRESAAAKADGEEIVKRMKDYNLGTWVGGDIKLDRMFTDQYRIGQPVIRKYPGGAVLKISCRLIPDAMTGISTLMGGSSVPLRDILFLVSDPSPYIGKYDESNMIIEYNGE